MSRTIEIVSFEAKYLKLTRCDDSLFLQRPSQFLDQLSRLFLRLPKIELGEEAVIGVKGG